MRHATMVLVLDGKITPKQASRYGQWCTARNLFDTPLHGAFRSSQPQKGQP